MARADPLLRGSVLRSDLSVVDGMPLLWAARLMGVPLPERVPGPNLFRRLGQDSTAPMKVFFFGGEDGVAAAACQRVNSENGGLQCVGSLAPGFGSIEQMSSDECIDSINASGAEFVVVSIGVAKGQAWIELNRDRLRAPVRAYLGAVVNFVAGTVNRAPTWMQQSGLEWLWRIKEEPSLWRRYASDAAVFARLLATRLLPYVWYTRRHGPDAAALAAARVEHSVRAGAAELQLRGAFTANNLGPLRGALAAACASEAAVRLDLREVTYMDSAAIALVCSLWAHCAFSDRPLLVTRTSPGVKRLVRYCCAEYAFEAMQPR
jgi:N-acetylglucosaminyldiphosphoundecaprenol N-acetyl-beta-D-mannosaminyltransferase